VVGWTPENFLDGRSLQLELLPSTLEYLRCVSCGLRLRREADELTCGEHRFIVRDGVPRFVTDDAYAGNFSFEWQVHDRTQLDDGTHRESEETFALKTGFSPSELAGKRVLDVGVGAGRFADVAARWGADVVGVDISFAVESARRNLEKYPTAQVVQADIFNLPFADSSFDYVFSIGVLHHTPDCHAAFSSLPRLLRPGGQLAVWLYNAYADNLRVNEAYRKISQRLPARVLYGLSHLAIPGYYLYRIPVLRSVLHHLLPTPSMHANWRWRVLDTYDWYSPKYQSRHTYPELYQWFKEAQLEDIEPLSEPVSMKGRRRTS
jgi:SAM-dependent methyltransferase